MNVQENGKEAYNQEELEEFRHLINIKLRDTRDELYELRDALEFEDEDMLDYDFEGSPDAIDYGDDLREKILKHETLIDHLEDALDRIDEGTYGVCAKTGRLIPKERLRRIPHTTICTDAENGTT